MTNDSNTRLISSHRSDQGNSNTFKREDCPFEFCDGIAQMSVGPGVVRLDLFVSKDTVEEDGQLVDLRQVTRTIAMPTAVFMEFLVNAFDGAVTNRALLNTAWQQIDERMQEKINSLKGDKAV